MEQPLITVIVPVYKTEPYLKTCVNSITNQTYSNLEIILVDDGSPDSSGQLCDKLAAEDPRIRVIHKQNGGLSSARNAGLDVMTGQFVGFIDSDDWIEPHMYDRLLSLALTNRAQIACGGMQCDYADGRIDYFNHNYPQDQSVEIFSKIDAMRESIRARKITPSMCDKLFSADIFRTLRFCEGIVNEDMELMPKCMAQVERVVYDPAPVYHYIIAGESITHGTFKKSRFTEAKLSGEHVKLYQAYPELYPYAVAKHVEICMNLVQASAASPEFAEERKSLIRDIRTYKISSYFRFLDRKDQIKRILFAISVPLFISVMTRYYNR